MNKFKKCMALILTGAMAFSLLAGCGGDGGTQVSTAGGNGSASGQQINLRAVTFGNNYDVQDMGWRWMMAECYEGLMRNVADENGDKFEFAGAESMDVSEDGLVYTFHLRENAKWSDGEPVTAHDYEYAWKRLLNPANAYDYASFIFNVVGAEEYYNGTGSVDDVAVKATDDYTFEVTLKVADPTFQSKLVATPLYPTREDIAEAAGDNWGKDWTLCVYNGPFAMTALVEDNSMTWTKNEYYWNAENVKLEQINWYCVPENATAATMFNNGQLDVLDASGEYIAKYEQKAENGELQSMDVEYPSTGMLCFDHKNGGLSGLMKNVNIRKAISYSIDREEMVSAVYGRYSAAYGLVSPAITFDGESYRSLAGDVIKTEYDSYAGDSAKLKELFQKGLDELGVTTPMSDIKLTLLSYGSTTENQLEREYIQQSLQQNLGITVELNTVGDSEMFIAKRDALDFDIFVSSWSSDYNDPMDFLNILTTGTYSSYGLYSNTEYDNMANSLTGVQDSAVRLETYKNMENKLLVEDCAVAPIYYADKHFYYQNWVQDFRTSSFGASQELYIAYIDGK